MTQASFSPSELLAVMGARLLQDDRAVFAGVGVPLLAAALARRTHAPRLTIVIEGGIVGPELKPGRFPISTNEMRAAYRATMLTGITDTFLLAQRGFLDYGFIGGAQIDRYGNLNSSAIGPYDRPRVRLPGSGGANDIISLCREIFVLTPHERRRFVERVDFVTSPSHLDGGDSRRKAGLGGMGVSKVVTTLGVLGFDESTKTMRLEAVHPGVSPEDVVTETGFDVLVSSKVETTEPPTAAELTALRSLDPEGRFLR